MVGYKKTPVDPVGSDRSHQRPGGTAVLANSIARLCLETTPFQWSAPEAGDAMLESSC
jgi:hypothetical protein